MDGGGVRPPVRGARSHGARACGPTSTDSDLRPAGSVKPLPLLPDDLRSLLEEEEEEATAVGAVADDLESGEGPVTPVRGNLASLEPPDVGGERSRLLLRSAEKSESSKPAPSIAASAAPKSTR